MVETSRAVTDTRPGAWSGASRTIDTSTIVPWHHRLRLLCPSLAWAFVLLQIWGLSLWNSRVRLCDNDKKKTMTSWRDSEHSAEKNESRLF